MIQLNILMKIVGSLTIKIQGYEGEYTGDINTFGQAHGHGMFVVNRNEGKSELNYTGTFRLNKIDGYCKCTIN